MLYLSDLLSNFNLFCYSDFPFLYINENVLKNLSNFRVISSCFVTQLFPSYIFIKFFWKIYETKFPSYIFIKCFWKIYENKTLYLSNFKLFYYSDFPLLYIHENLWKKQLVHKIIFKVLSSGKWKLLEANSRLSQNSKFKIFEFCFLWIFVLGSSLPQVAPFPTT